MQLDYFMYSIGMTASFLGVCVKTLRRWHAKGMIACYRTLGGYRRFPLNELFKILEERQDGQQERNEKKNSSSIFYFASHSPYWSHLSDILNLQEGYS